MGENGTTKVRFDLWVVLAFIGAFAFYGFIYLTSTLAEGRAARILSDQKLEVRVTKLEANYDFIQQGICDLKTGQTKVVDALAEHEKSTARLIKNGGSR